MAGSGLQPEGSGTRGSPIGIRVLDTLAILLCVMIVVLIVLAIVNHGSGHEAAPIAAMAASLAAISASRANLARGRPPLDAAANARRKTLVLIALLIAVVGALAGVGAALFFRAG